MIRYALTCNHGHEFESWFRDADAYEKQAADHALSCPLCRSPEVKKSIMAPQVARGDRTIESDLPQPMALVPPDAAAFRAKLKALRSQLTENSEDVGKRFPEEARRIHFGESEQRSIHGQAGPDEVKALIDEGVDVLPLPTLPDDWN